MVYCDALHFFFFFSEISYYLYKVNCDRIDTVCSENDCSYVLFNNDLYFLYDFTLFRRALCIFCHSLRLCAPTFTPFVCCTDKTIFSVHHLQHSFAFNDVTFFSPTMFVTLFSLHRGHIAFISK